jgi:hypothetical protein
VRESDGSPRLLTMRQINKPADPIRISPTMPSEEMRKAQETTTQAAKVLEEIQKAEATFFITDVDLALTFTRICGDAAKFRLSSIYDKCVSVSAPEKLLICKKVPYNKRTMNSGMQVF